MERRLAAILAADVVGYSRLMGEDEIGTLNALKVVREELIDAKSKQYHGRIIKLMGDGILMEFPSVVDAVMFAVEVQCAMADRNAHLQESKKLSFRIGINIGDVIVEDHDVYGDGVNVAARLESLADPGGICVRRNVRNQTRDKINLDFEDLGEAEVKNISRPLRVFRLVLNEKARALSTPILEQRKSTLSPRRVGFLAASLAGLLLCAGLILWQPWADVTHTDDIRRATTDMPSIAVLPFSNIGGNPEQDYFADGMTDDLINDLSQISGLFVIARNSAFSYKGRAVNVPQVAEELGVRYILEGSVRRQEDSIRINVQLVDGKNANQLWAQRYDRASDDIFALQDEVIDNIIEALQIKLTGKERAQVNRLPTKSLKAYDYFLRAEHLAYRADPQSVAQALTLYEKAIALDAEFAEAFAGFGRVAMDVLMFSMHDAMPAAVARSSAYNAAGKALTLNADLARGYSVLALLQMLDSQHETALQSAHKATELSPNNAESYLNLALVQVYAGRQEEALGNMRKVLKLNPKPPRHVRDYQALVYYMNRDYKAAINSLGPMEDEAQGEFALEALAMSYARLGNMSEAQKVIERHIDRWPDQSLALYEIVYAHHAKNADLEHRLEGLRMAGMPQWPYAFRADGASRLDAKAIGALSFGRTWKGQSKLGQFAQFIDENGDLVERAARRQVVGKASLKGNLLCIQLPALALGRQACGPVYQSTSSTIAGTVEYIYVNALDIKRFSVY